MTLPELESMCDSEEALRDVNPDKADGRKDLADWICEELKIKKPEEASGRRRMEDPPRDRERGEDDGGSRLRRMREERDR